MDKKIPYFKYHPDPIKTGGFKITELPIICECCGLETVIRSVNETAVFVCPDCIHNGKAYEKFSWGINDIPDWIRDDNVGIVDDNKIDELMCRTPGYPCLQHKVWPVHCDDFCAYMGRVHTGDLKRMRIYTKIKTYLREEGAYNEGEYGTAERLKKPNGYAEGILYGGCERYLFRCLHCGKYLLHYDYD